MQAPFDNIVQHLFHQPSLHSVTVDELENMAQQHPYYAAAHFLLLKKMQDTEHPQFNTQLHKTTLYFNNPLWLQYLLQPETVADFGISENAPFIIDDPSVKPAFVEEYGNGYKNGHTATAYQLKEEEVLTEKEQPPFIEEPVIDQEHDTRPQHSNGGIMDVITEVFNDENNNTANLPVAEGPSINETAEIHISEAIIDNNNEAVDDTEITNGVAAETETAVFIPEEIPEFENEPPVETPHEQLAERNDQNVEEHTENIHEEQAEHITAASEKEEIIEEPQFTNSEEEIIALENTTVEETKHDGSGQENYQGAEGHTENVPEEISAETYTAPVEDIPAFANEEVNTVSFHEESIAPVAESSTAEFTTAIDEPQPVLEEEQLRNDSFNEDVTSSVIATIEENNAVAEIPAEAIIDNGDAEQVEIAAAVSENVRAIDAEKTATQDADDTEKAEISKEASPEPEKPMFRNIIETPASKHDFLFEPYHTVDYFASQGIKLSKIEANSKDKLGRQLKSFTEWLKSMKRLPQASIDKILSENEESRVVADAIHSIEKKDVITEAMAEVFEKQGMRDEAAGVYQKLSLLNPAKSAYFAAKIEALKH